MHHAQGDLADVRRQRRQVGLRAHDLEGAPGDLLRVADVAVESRGHAWFFRMVRAAPPPPQPSPIKGEGEGWRAPPISPPPLRDRKSVVSGKSVAVRVDLGGRRVIKKKTKKRIT